MIKIALDLYRTNVWVTDSEQEFAGIYTTKSGEPFPEGNAGLMWNAGGGDMYIGVWAGHKDLLNTVVHECTHCALHIADRISLKKLTKEQEPMCYLMGYLVHEVLKAFPHLNKL